MRRIHRTGLPKRALAYLKRRQTKVDQGQDAGTAWESARRTKTMRTVEHTLRAMSRGRQRCMFCEDSRGTDIDHFWPKSRYSNRTFVWENLLLACAGCNGKKGKRFDLGADGRPLLIDPTAEDPWDFLFFDPDTGIIVARFNLATGATDPKGEHTTDPQVLPLNIDPVTDGRQRIARSLRRAVGRFLGCAEGDPAEALDDLLAELRDHDDYGLLEWYFLRDGQDDSPFSDLRARHPTAWGKIAKTVGSGFRVP